MFQKKILSSAIAGVLSTMAVMPALAQDQNVEEVFVTGIRASLEASMDVKRESAGVVDAISSEDIGKFPDSNLAESLQRITGVSIDRVNGEGSQITVRGFGPEFNMVTINGRVMPSGTTYGGGSGAGYSAGGATRAFDFANIASESVQGVEVFKTGRASIASGGIGAAVNIKTARPLDKDGVAFTVAGKAVHDSTTRIGNFVTPELSGLFSWSNGTFGASFTGSYQKRDSGAANASANAWNIDTWDVDANGDYAGGLYHFRGEPQDVNGPNYEGNWPEEGYVIVNAPDKDQLYARPNDFRWAYSDRQRERTNAQATFQWAPTDAITTTLDYTYAKNDLWEHRGEWTQWMGNGTSSPVVYVEFDDSDVATPILIGEEESGNRDVGYEQQLRMQQNILDSVGLNVDWQVSDNLTLVFDAHDSSMESLPSGPGDSGEIAISIGAPVSGGYTWDFSKDMPVGWFDLNDDDQNPNGRLDEKDAGSAQGRVWYAGQTTDITQVQLSGAFTVTDTISVDFGVSSVSTEMLQQSSVNQVGLGGWGVASPGEFENGSFYEFNFTDYFDDYDMSRSAQTGLRATDVWDLCRQTELLYGDAALGTNNTSDNQGWKCQALVPFDNDNTLEETVTGGYIQVALEGDLNDRPWHLLAGVRFEQTDLTSTARMKAPLYRIYEGNNDFQTTQYLSDDLTSYVIENDYTNTLPSIDFDIEVVDDIVLRASYSTTISRPNYNNLFSSTSGWSQSNPTGYSNATPAASRNNPLLIPLESSNVDMSLEWYYKDGSYVSLGFFDKQVSNFIGTTSATEQHYDMKDITDPNNSRMQAVYDRLIDRGLSSESDPYAAGNDAIFAQTVCLTYTDDYNKGYGDRKAKTADEIAQLQSMCSDESWWDGSDTAPTVAGTTDSFYVWIEKEYDIHALMSDNEHPDFEEDNTANWSTSYPLNTKDAGINGAEFAFQHFFGDSGFGIQANYTLVDGDVEFDDLKNPSADDSEQFALLGLSDTMNIVGIYENYGLQVRLAYNWRDSFLRQTNVDNQNFNPIYVDEYSQWDMNASYDVNDNFNVFFEGINLTGENVRWYQRSDSQTRYVEELGPRYQLGVRYTY